MMAPLSNEMNMFFSLPGQTSGGEEENISRRPSGKLLQFANWKITQKSPFVVGKSTISMFNSYVLCLFRG